jgi:hypothetical protein
MARATRDRTHRETDGDERLRSPSHESKKARRQGRDATLVFTVVAAASVPLYLWRGRDQWFYLDEWDFLAGRRVSDVSDLFRPHNEHWQTLPIIAYRFMWRLFGLHSYRPYQILAIAMHLALAALVLTVMRRAGANPWISTAAAALFVLFGAGHENIIWAFQIGFVATMVFGLSALILADHDGGFGRRDAIAIAFGVASLMSSGVGVTMAFVVSLAVLLRRGWRPAACYAVSLGAVFMTWWLAFGRGAKSYPVPRSVVDVLGFIAVGVTNTFGRLGQLPGVGIALGALLVGGLVLAWGRLPVPELRRQAAAPAALLAGTVVFLFIVAMGRVGAAFEAIDLGVIKHASDSARAGRYVHLLAAMVLPAIAIAATAIARRWRLLGPVVVLLLLIGIPGNVAAIEQTGSERFRLGQRRYVLTLTQSPFAAQMPRGYQPLGPAGPEMTMGWLLDNTASGQIPTVSVTPSQNATLSLALTLHQRPSATPLARCAPLTAPAARLIPRGGSFGFSKGPIVVRLRLNGATSAPRTFSSVGQSRLVALAGPLDLLISPAPGLAVPSVCS